MLGRSSRRSATGYMHVSTTMTLVSTIRARHPRYMYVCAYPTAKDGAVEEVGQDGVCNLTGRARQTHIEGRLLLLRSRGGHEGE